MPDLLVRTDPVTAAAVSVARTLDIEMRGLRAMRDALDEGLGTAFARAADAIEGAAGNVIVTGIGKSGIIARKLAATLSSTGTPSHYLHPADASHGDLGALRAIDVVLALSWSGETTELADIVEYSRRFGVPLIAVTARADSALGRAADIGLFLPAAEEACPHGLAPTTSTAMQLAAGDALAVLLLERRGFTATDFNRYHPGGKLGLRLTEVRRLMHEGGEMPLVPLSATLSEGIVEMTSKRFGTAGVVDESGRLVGVLTDGDVRRAFQNSFRDRPIAEAMGTAPQTTTADALAVAVLARMNAKHITSMFVVEDREPIGPVPIGLVHVHDLLRARIA